MRVKNLMMATAFLSLLVGGSVGTLFAKQTSSSPTQQQLEKRVRHALVTLPRYSVFDNLAYSVDNGKVTLMGEVLRPSLKADAEDAVKRVEGVTSINDKIEVLPISPRDDRIRREVYRAIFGQEALSYYSIPAIPPIHIIVKNGNVVLEGAVATQSDKTLATIRADAVPGVFSVTNNLKVG